MKHLTLTRNNFNEQFGTFGYLESSGFRWLTIERTWLNNQRNISCIPTGIYKIEPCHYYRGGYDAYEIMDVPDRDNIKFHKASVLDDVLGCCGLGYEYGWYKGKWAIIKNTEAFESFMTFMNNESGVIEIVNYKP